MSTLQFSHLLLSEYLSFKAATMTAGFSRRFSLKKKRKEDGRKEAWNKRGFKHRVEERLPAAFELKDFADVAKKINALESLDFQV